LAGALSLLPLACGDAGSTHASGAAGSGGTSASSSTTGGQGTGGQGTGGHETADGGSDAGMVDARPACNQGMMPICDPYGVSMPEGPLSDSLYWGAVKQVAAPFYRPPPQSISALAANPAACSMCDAAVSHGFSLVLVLANGGPPASPSAYSKTVGAALDRYEGHVAALVVEDEPTSTASWSGTPAEYLAELSAGCTAAHARGVRCANGGIGSTSMLLLTASYYESIGVSSEALPPDGV
jgi:hypothetical protein